MKKFLAVLLIASMSIGLVACGSSKETKDAAAEEQKEEAPAARRKRRCGVFLAPKGAFPLQVRTKPLLWRRFGATRRVSAATPYETPAVASPLMPEVTPPRP